MRLTRVRWKALAAVAVLFSQSSAADVITDLRSEVLIKAEGFEITKFDLFMYLRPELDPESGQPIWGSQAGLREGLQQLYALNTLRMDAAKIPVLVDEQKIWIADYELMMYEVKEYLAAQVAKEAAAVNYEALAEEYYQANKEEFLTPETLTIRTMLIKTECLSQEGARQKIYTLMEGVKTPDDFAAVVAAHTEDEAARESAGLMRGVVRGQTVDEFENAAFALEEVGQFSEIVFTRFGAHVIQLLEKQVPTLRSFESVKERLIPQLEQQEADKILTTLRMEAREKRPPGLELNQALLKSFIAEATP